ncbi:MAG: penicillin-binding transpeptidase domain-containing protein, partial [Bacteroidales bacterium]
VNGGAGKTAASAYVPYLDVCGKTGTAQNPHGADHSIFICFAPRHNPQIAVAVYIENSGFGATWAAPTASLIVEKYLKRNVSRTWVEERVVNANLLPYNNVVKK